MYYLMLDRYERISLNPNMELISKGMSSADWTQMKKGINNIMDSSRHVGSGYVYYACAYIM